MTATMAGTGTSRWYRHAQVSLGVAVAAGTGLLVAGDVDPVHEMLSDAIQTVPGAVLLMVAACALASAGLWLAAGAWRTLPRPALFITLVLVWSAALVAVAFFPTNLPGTTPDMFAVVHRVGAGLMAALPPLFALLLAEQATSPRTVPLRVAGLTTLAACIAFGAMHGPSVLLGAEPFPYVGMIERILLALVLVVAGLCTWVLDGSSGATGVPRRRLDRAGVS
ncbi:DUF998 domain-containing protein [Actinoplanes bogorensis]|uniref:DUF998 domain-containing protein n=1 Tax=Paractinoplanes bogorensis TaxID=1610840 RepID=A0ABS5YPB0_9ACTN|nr:DUF998 domain-containing protein [Actinoplanes bogorensis]MBU2664896.1 DUF998 domain-containing protein [Actinoplanes bogorensis]